MTKVSLLFTTTHILEWSSHFPAYGKCLAEVGAAWPVEKPPEYRRNERFFGRRRIDVRAIELELRENPDLRG